MAAEYDPVQIVRVVLHIHLLRSLAESVHSDKIWKRCLKGSKTHASDSRINRIGEIYAVAMPLSYR